MRPKRKPALESRYLIAVATLLAGALAVCAPMVLVQATAEQDTSWLDAEPAIAPYAVADKGWDAVVVPEPVVTADFAARVKIAELPPAIPLAQAEPENTGSLQEAKPDIATLSTGLVESESAVPSDSGANGPAPEPVQAAALDEAPRPEELSVSEALSSDIMPLPTRRPAAPIETAEIVVAQEAQVKQAAKPRQVARAERRNDEPRRGEPSQRWKPMALAPADADTPAAPKLSNPAPKRTPDSGEASASHQSKIWSALARAKPRTGERGSATVTFTIGANGALRGARVTRSSGNTKIDRMALATVRKAGPFPPSKSGAASYTIRIDF